MQRYPVKNGRCVRAQHQDSLVHFRCCSSREGVAQQRLAAQIGQLFDPPEPCSGTRRQYQAADSFVSERRSVSLRIFRDKACLLPVDIDRGRSLDKNGLPVALPQLLRRDGPGGEMDRSKPRPRRYLSRGGAGRRTRPVSVRFSLPRRAGCRPRVLSRYTRPYGTCRAALRWTWTTDQRPSGLGHRPL